MISRSAALVLAPALLAATAFPALAADSSTPDAGALGASQVVRLSGVQGRGPDGSRESDADLNTRWPTCRLWRAAAFAPTRAWRRSSLKTTAPCAWRRTLLLGFQSWNGWRRAPLYRRCDWCAARRT